MGDKGGKKNKHKSDQQISDKHKQKERDNLDKQSKGQPEMGLVTDKTAHKKK